MSEFDEDNLEERVKRALSHFETSYRAEKHSADITLCLQQALRVRANREKTGEAGIYEGVPELVALVADAQRRIKEETERGETYEHIHDVDGVLGNPCESEVLHKEDARKQILECYQLVQSWKEKLSREEVPAGRAGICRPSRSLCERLAMRTDDELAGIAATFQSAGVHVAIDDCTVSVTFPDGVEAFWCVCQNGHRVEGRSALDASLARSVFVPEGSEETATCVRRELLLFLFLVAKSLAWH